MAGKMRSFRFDDDAAWTAAQERAKGESRAFGDVLAELIRSYAAGEVPAASLEAVMTAPPVVMTAPAAGAPVMTAPRRRGYPCCKHCPRPHGGHSDPCTQGC